MTIEQVIKSAKGIKPNSFSNETITMWINEVEGMVQTDVMLLSLADVITYNYDDHKNTELLVKTPHDKIYVYFVVAMIDFANNEYNLYTNTLQLFNKYFADYTRWYALRINPANGRADIEGYYLSAYALALKHGYTGTEDEWVASLKGERGPQGHGWIVSGFVQTADDLPGLGATWNGIYIREGVVFGVGTKEPYEFYVMAITDDGSHRWIYQGPFSPILAQSWAVGGTGYREGESTDNAKYYSKQAQKHADEAAEKILAQTTAATEKISKKEAEAIDNFNLNANDALEEINKGVTETKRNAQDAIGSALLARDRVELAKSWAVGESGYREGEDTDNAKYYSEETEKQVKLAQQTVEEAQSLRDDVQTYPPIAERNARTAESWARGGTGIREGEDTDNAKYYSEQIGNHANDAKYYAQKAEQHANDAGAAVDLARQHSNASGSYSADSAQFADEAKGYADEAKGYAEKAADEANNAYVAKSGAERIAEQTHSYVGEAQRHVREAQQYAEEAQLRASDSGVASMTAGEYAEESRNSANEAKGYAEQAQNAVVGINTPYANALKGEAFGEMVSMKDISPIEHKIKVELSSKNLIPYPYKNTTRTQNGITFTDNKDGSITVNGTATANTFFDIAPIWGEYNLPAGSYFLSGCPAGGGSSTYRLALAFKSKNTSGANIFDGSDVGQGRNVNISEDATQIYCRIIIIQGFTANNIVFKPQLEIGTVATVYTPYVADVSGAKLYKQGKNLLDIDSMLNEFLTKNGDEYTMTRTNNKRFSNYMNTYIPAGTPLIFKTGGITSYGVDNIAVGLQLIFEDGTSNTNLSLGKSNTPKTITLGKNVTRIALYVNNVEAIGTPITTFKNPMLEVGTAATEYEPYIEPVEVDKDNVTSLYPTTTLYSDTSGVLIEAEYNRDLNKVIAEIYNAIANL